ncbi:GNAT family N-acetyltransferase [Actinomadura fulvescens]|uniref:GNAT family N-acetyltransferase n=1 Tax=Actinomadura fulvescens TaxID=46160 RepID=A0ABN3PNY4_9ACTN
MTPVPVLTTERLILRGWHDDDRAPFAAMNADPAVMEHFPATLTRAESDALIDRITAGFARHGFGLWAVETARTGTFIGLTGLSVPAFDAHFLPGVEIGWRLATTAQGHGYATEAARRALAFGFQDAGLNEIVSFTSTTNHRSQAVMRRIGMTHDPADDFDHPAVPDGHPVKRHVLYRIDAATWAATAHQPAR